MPDFALLNRMRGRLILLVLLALLPALALMLLTALEHRRLTTEFVETSTQRQVRLLAGDLDRTIELAHHHLAILARLPEIQASDATACSAALADLLAHEEHYTNLGVIDRDGTVFCSALPLPASPDPAALGLGRALEPVLRQRQFATGGYTLDPATGIPALFLGHPLLDSAGEVQSVVFATLDLARVNQRIADSSPPESVAVLGVDQDGTILLRYPDAQDWLGRALPSAHVVATLLAEGEGLKDLVDLDGESRLYAFVGVGEPPRGLAVGIGVSRALAFAPADAVWARSLIAFLVVGLLAIAVAWFVGDLLLLGRLRAIVRAAGRLRDGDLSARSGLAVSSDEIGRLGAAFDGMAAALEQRDAELSRAESRYRTLAEHTPAITYAARLDASFSPVYVSPQVETVLGYSPSEWLADPELWVHRLHPDDRERVLAELREAHQARRHFRSEHRLLARDGRVVWIRDESTLVPGRPGQPNEIQGIMLDITDRKAAEAMLEHRAVHDPLTDLPNRTLFFDRLHQALLTAEREQKSAAVLVVDLDGFKPINDLHGHHVGDLLLREVARRLRAALRASDTVARLGGDEFAAVLPSTEQPGATLAAGKIARALALPILADGKSFHIRASIGIALAPASGRDPFALVRHADEAMYEAKRAGGGVAVYSPPLAEERSAEAVSVE